MPASPSTGFRVHPAELADAGLAARRTAERLQAGANAVPAAGDAAVAALPGWRTAVALDECTEAWHRALVRLAAELEGIGADLQRTASDYEATEAEIRRSLRPGS
ncbi:hypothetical protein GCM10010193_43600 [Kitasatospora atroaurantiaca]|uniref:Excreted virulence factor EspC (Type VII ESX diderm) n=1 Tax=Kitasatospora atroaurantiaca TaxID=285545 RepID=A0A561ETN5_9ACTN|nr:type VII secretion target [Kitasatospora atroaurantiaca]TWE18972.1 excreted virulence factor EspC (type VII ESX diderm) [Kitasatospora atroaurantiaca]